MFNIVELRDDSILVTHDNTKGKFAIARYDDEGGPFYYDEKLVKRYVGDSPVHVETTPEPEVDKEEYKTPRQKTYRFEIHKFDRYDNLRHYKRNVKAYNFREACSKIDEIHPVAYDIEIIEIKDADGFPIVGINFQHEVHG